MGGGGRVGGVQGGCERRSVAFVKIKKKKIIFFLGGWGGQGRGGGLIRGWGGSKAWGRG